MSTKRSVLREVVLTIGSIIVMVLLFGWLLNIQKNENTESIKQATELKQKNDSLRAVLIGLEELSRQAEVNHKTEVEYIVRTYENKLKQVEKKYYSKKNDIKNLPLTDKVLLLSDFMWESDSTPKIVEIDGDTTIQLIPQHVDILNNAYIDLEECNEKYYLCRDANDSLVDQLYQGMDIVQMKSKEIDIYKDLDMNNKVLIKQLGDQMVADRKLHRKQLLTVGGISLGVGSIITLILVK